MAPSASVVFTIVNPLAPPFLLQLADLIDDVTPFNGNDATTLSATGWKWTFWEVGVNPGEGWPVNDVTMLHHTLVRNADVTVGSDDWDVVQFQWQDYPENTYDWDHTANPCGIDTNATPTLASACPRSALKAMCW